MDTTLRFKSVLNTNEIDPAEANSKPLWDVVAGYYGTDEACLATDLVSENNENSLYLQMYQTLGM